MKNGRRLAAALLLILASSCNGLKDHRVAPPPRPVEAIVAHVNANNTRLKGPFYAPVVSVSATLYDEDGKRHDFDLRGPLVYQHPRSVWLRLDHALEENQMQLGSNDAEYWLVIRRDFSTMWWGKYEHVGKPCVRPMPIDPTRAPDALGMIELPFGVPAGPLRICDERVDRLLYGRVDPMTGVMADREYAVDRFEPNMIREVRYFDRLGQEEMHVWLDDYKPLGDGGPLMARKVRIEWPLDKGRLRMEIEGLTVRDDVHPQAFVRPAEPPEGIRDVVQVDESCESGTTTDGE